MMLLALAFFTLIVMNFFIGVISEAYEAEKKQVIQRICYSPIIHSIFYYMYSSRLSSHVLYIYCIKWSPEPTVWKKTQVPSRIYM